METKVFADEVISDFNKSITDAIFLHIQNNKDLMQKYLHLIAEKGSKKDVNKVIGKHIKEKYGLTHDGIRNDCPVSTLIVEHTEFN
jgi:hypothetical protein